MSWAATPVECFSQQLLQLNKNSDLQIRALTDFSSLRKDLAPQLADILVKHVHQVCRRFLFSPPYFPRGQAEPAMKIPAFYLMDSILKACRVPYESLFTPSIVGCCVAACRVARDPVLVVLQTWNHPNGPFFTPELRAHILDVLGVNAPMKRNRETSTDAPAKRHQHHQQSATPPTVFVLQWVALAPSAKAQANFSEDFLLR